MNPLAILFGIGLVKKVTDYPSEIKKLQKQLPAEERKSFAGIYKQLTGEQKNQFKSYLTAGDYAKAGEMIGKDLSKYQTVKLPQQLPADAMVTDSKEGDFTARINQLLTTSTPSIDQSLVAAAAKKYQDSSLQGLDIAARTKRILDLYSK